MDFDSELRSARAEASRQEATAGARSARQRERSEVAKIAAQAVRALSGLRADTVVQVEPAGLFARGTRYRTLDQRRYRVVDEQRCWKVAEMGATPEGETRMIECRFLLLDNARLVRCWLDPVLSGLPVGHYATVRGLDLVTSENAELFCPPGEDFLATVTRRLASTVVAYERP